MLRLVRMTSKESERNMTIENMAQCFLDRGYHNKLLGDTKVWAKSLDREEILKGSRRSVGNEEDLLYYVTTYDTCTPLIKKSVLQQWPIIKTDKNCHQLTAKGSALDIGETVT
ncbi:hypothetical protein XELAEV_18005998mg [Xenopus laevis]|uniref:Uncharacterized protein n=1 Tax=Xenopus laevis TaxID=8355 RepID=A0A974I359_XENLA|nr:hypothetical protein XELAEV_18005998mg [Xenopus laevis]